MAGLVEGVEQIVDGIHRIQFAYRPIGSVNVFVLTGSDGVDLVDTGPMTAGYADALDAVLGELGLGGVEAVRTVATTHAHTDHIGQAAEIQRRSGAICLVDPEGIDFAHRRYQPRQDRLAIDWFLDHGLPDELADRFSASLPTLPEMPEVTPFPPVVDLGGAPWRVVPAPGHAPGHVVLHDVHRRLMFTGDSVLPGFVPLLDIQPFREEGVVSTYLAGLRELRASEVGLVLPGHGPAFEGLASRIDALIDRHQSRMRTILDLCRSGSPTGYDLCLAAFGSRPAGIVRLRMSLGQTIGYLSFLRAEGRVEPSGADRPIRWRSSA